MSSTKYEGNGYDSQCKCGTHLVIVLIAFLKSGVVSVHPTEAS